MKIAKLELSRIPLIDDDTDDECDGREEEIIDESDDSQFLRSLDCPYCGTVWYSISDGEADLADTCEHLRFIWEQSADGIEAYNGFNIERFADAVVIAYRKVFGNDSDYETPVDLLHSIMFDEDVWASIQSPDVDELWDHTQEFMSCGPSSYTVLFGVKTGV